MAATVVDRLDGLKEQYITRPSNPLKHIYAKVLEGQRISRDEAIEVYECDDLLSVGILADTARILRTPVENRDYVYWVHNFHINPTNICELNCKFCSYKKGEKSPFAYAMSVDDVVDHVNQYSAKDTLSEFHIVSGLYPEQGLEYYVDLFKALKKHFPHVHIKGLTAVELDYFAKLAGITVEETILTLKDAGLQSLPGGGAEVFAPRVREEVCPSKITGEQWLDIHGKAHKLGLKSNATLLAGLGETYQERIDHALALRDQQDLTGGFMCFIPLNCYYEGNKIDPAHAQTGVENLKNFAVSRLILDNVPHLKAFWIHIGEKLSQVGLNFGVDDVDGTVVEEKIAHAAGTESAEHMTKQDLLTMIWKAGKTPVERDTTYQILNVYPRPDKID